MRILTVVGTYLPGYKSGGPIRSVANLIALLGNEFEFYVLTSDRDKGDNQPYPGIQKGIWHTQGNAQVMYLSPDELTLSAWYSHLRSLTYDLIYLNGCFLPLTIKTLVLRRLNLIPRVPIVLAPRGEFSPGALALKAYKKHPYLQLTNVIGLYEGIRWQASNNDELGCIRKQIHHPFHFVIAPPIAEQADLNWEQTRLPASIQMCATKERGKLRVIFLSRISRKKNLDFAINLLRNNKGEIHFDIYGPIEDQAYWQECQHMMSELPPQIHAQYCGMVPHQEVTQIFRKYHLFLFPTHGENFGHVMLESLSAGCPVLTSDQTPWHDLARQGGGWNVPLSDITRFQAILDTCIAMDQTEFNAISASAHAFATMYFQSQNENIVQAYRELFSGTIPERVVNQNFNS
jgi:glycosyltransferase involved in cell wall biosynthesis